MAPFPPFGRDIWKPKLEFLAQHQTNWPVLRHQLGGAEHEIVEFALRVMAATEQIIGHEFNDVYRDINTVQSVDYACRALNDFRQGLMTRPDRDDGSALHACSSPVQRVMEESPESPDEDTLVISSEGE